MRTVLLSYATVVRRVSSGVRLETGERVKRSPVSFNCTHFTPVGVECQVVKICTLYRLQWIAFGHLQKQIPRTSGVATSSTEVAFHLYTPRAAYYQVYPLPLN